MHAVDTAIGVGWGVFWLGWLAASAATKSGRPAAGGRIAVRVAVVIAVVVLANTGLARGHAAAKDPALGVVGLVLFGAGLALAVWARVYIGRNWGTPMSEKDDPELVTRGPYGRVRHPIYSGIILAMAGTAVAVSAYWLVVFVPLGAYFVYSAFVEEADMMRLFPEQYPRYRRATKMLIPYVF